ncbi:protein of unknown function [Xenorhabdus doucetiae]|uniref:Uncharacterized protein n=1 Tax=Xenorhabdus doucetiae TaxID=351671 RepID=A0A068QVV7_9GAMM|nr:protein of unknown function [Xenorhabdus doucetiae]
MAEPLSIKIDPNYPASLFRQWPEQTEKKPLTHTFVIDFFSLSEMG